MRKAVGRVVVLAVVSAVMASFGGAAAAQGSNDSYRPFPKGFDYPIDQKTIHQWVDAGDWKRIREHGWNLYVGMRGTGPTSPQVWETWFSLPATFATGAIEPSPPVPHRTLHNKHAAAAGSHGIPDAPKYNSHNCTFKGLEFLNNGDIMIAGIYYNEEAYKYVRDNGYYKLETMRALWAAGKPSVEPFPKESISIKHMYWPVRHDGLTALPVSPHYNPAPDPADKRLPVIPKDPTAYNGYETWRTGVAIAPSADIRKAAGPTAEVTYLYIDDPDYKPVTFAKAPVVPIESFYYRQIGEAEWKGMDPVDRCILNNAAMWTYKREFRAKDYLVSVAMHITTKEFPNWTMQSFWWTPEPNFGRYAKDRPKTLPKGVWQNYAMCTAYDMVEPKEGDGTPAVCANPYIELVIPETYRSVSNCQNCHIRGAFPSAGVLTDVVTQDAHYNSERRGEIGFGDRIFNGLVATDFSWSIPLATTPHPAK